MPAAQSRFAVGAVAAFVVSAASANFLTNGGFETDPAGTEVTGSDYIINNSITGYRTFAVGGAEATYTVSTAAARSGNVGLEISRGMPGADSALDKEGLWDAVPAQQRIYKYTMDARDAGPFGGTPLLRFSAQVPGNGDLRNYFHDPFAVWEKTGFTVRTDGSGQLGVRVSLTGGNQSAHIDNLTAIDVTNADRMINGGFENSNVRPLDWRFVNINGGAGSATISNDAFEGNNALLLERTNTDGIVQFDVDDPQLRVAALPFETLNINFASKQVAVAGDDTASLLLSVAMFDAAGNFLGNVLSNPFNPVEGAYTNYSVPITLNHPNVAFMTTVFNIRDVGNPGLPAIGSYLIDGVSVVPEPASLVLMTLCGAFLAMRRR